MAKILMITGLGSVRDLASDKKGAFYYTLEEFHKYWDRIDIMCPRIKGQEPGVKSLFGNVFMHISPWPLIFHPIWFLKKGVEIYKEQKFDLMTVQEFPPFYNGIGARLLWNKIKAPYILEIHHIAGYPRTANFKGWLYKTATRFFIKRDTAKARVVRVVNKKQVPNFLIKAGVPGDKIIYISSFYIDLDTFRPMGLDKKYDLVFASRLEKNKGIGLLLQAMSNVKIKMPNVKLLIVGSGPLKAKLQNYVKRNGLEHNVFFSGWLETLNDVARAYNSAKIFINPSFNEGGPRVALEAMACGLPVITTEVGAMLDVINDGENGLFADWSPEEMSEKILWLLERPDVQNRFSGEGLKIAEQFEKSTMIKNYAGKLKEILQ